jgi:hypothetical protein
MHEALDSITWTAKKKRKRDGRGGRKEGKVHKSKIKQYR